MLRERHRLESYAYLLFVSHDAQAGRRPPTCGRMGRHAPGRGGKGGQRRVPPVSRTHRGQRPATYETRSRIDGKLLLQLPYALYDLRAIEGAQKSYDQQSHRGRKRRGRQTQRVQLVSSRQDASLDVGISRALVRDGAGGL